MIRSLSLIALAALLTTAPAAADDDKPAPSAAPPKPADAVLQCSGTEPFWALTLYPDAARFEPMDGPVVARMGRPQRLGHGRVGWAFRSGDGGLVVTAIRTESCSDGMSDIVHPLDAVIALPDGSWRQGCCHPANEPPPREGQ